MNIADIPCHAHGPSLSCRGAEFEHVADQELKDRTLLAGLSFQVRIRFLEHNKAEKSPIRLIHTAMTYREPK